MKEHADDVNNYVITGETRMRQSSHLALAGRHRHGWCK